MSVDKPQRRDDRTVINKLLYASIPTLLAIIGTLAGIFLSVFVDRMQILEQRIFDSTRQYSDWGTVIREIEKNTGRFADEFEQEMKKIQNNQVEGDKKLEKQINKTNQELDQTNQIIRKIEKNVDEISRKTREQYNSLQSTITRFTRKNKE